MYEGGGRHFLTYYLQAAEPVLNGEVYPNPNIYRLQIITLSQKIQTATATTNAKPQLALFRVSNI